MPNPQIDQEEEEYHGLLKEGYHKPKLVRTDDDSGSIEKVSKSEPYEEWTKEELYQQAIKAGIPGRSYMSKKNLIYSLKKI